MGLTAGHCAQFFGHFQICDRNPLNAQTKADPNTSTNAGGTNASATGSRSQAIPPNFTSPVVWKRPPCVTALQVISIKRILSGRPEKVETLLVRFCFLADDECRSETRMVPASFERRLKRDILAPSDCAYAAYPKD